MQQTDKYKLNLIESSDPFLPDGLNQNTLKLEEVVSQHLEGMDQRVTVLEDKKFACGLWTKGAGVFDLGFHPRAVITQQIGSYGPVIYVENATYASSGGITLTENGFKSNISSFYFLAFS